MVLKLHVTKQDLEKGKLLNEENWFEFELTGIRSKEAASKTSTNYFLEFTGRSGIANNVEITKLINSANGLEPLYKIIEIMTGQVIDRESEEGLDIDLHLLTGGFVDGYVVRGENFASKEPENQIKMVARHKSMTSGVDIS